MPVPAGEWFLSWALLADGRTVEDRGTNSPHYAFDRKQLSEAPVCSIAPYAKARLSGFKVLGGMHLGSYPAPPGS
jgi:hypothetical protein